MASIIERYAFSLISRLDNEYKKEEQKKYDDFKKFILNNPNSISPEFKSNVQNFFKRLIIMSLCPNQEDTYEDICLHLEDWYKNLSKLQYKEGQNDQMPTQADLEGKTPDFTLSPKQRAVLLQKWKERKRTCLETKKKENELGAILNHIQSDFRLLSSNINSLQKKKDDFTGPSFHMEKRTQYIQTDLIKLIDHLNLKIRRLNNEILKRQSGHQ